MTRAMGAGGRTPHRIVIVGGSLLIHGLIARLMYTSLYKVRQVSNHGFVRVAFYTVGRLLRGRLEPRMKLH